MSIITYPSAIMISAKKSDEIRSWVIFHEIDERSSNRIKDLKEQGYKVEIQDVLIPRYNYLYGIKATDGVKTLYFSKYNH